MSILNYIERIKRENESPRITAQEPRNMYAGGQLVQNTADGSRPGYAENKYYTKTDPFYGKGAYVRPAHMKKYENIMKEYEKFLQKELKTGNMSETKNLKNFLWGQGKKGIQKYDFLTNMITYAGKSPAADSSSLLNNTKNTLLRKLVDDANKSLHIKSTEPGLIFKKVLSPGFIGFHPPSGVYTLKTTPAWLDKNYLNTKLDTKSDKATKAFEKLIKDDAVITTPKSKGQSGIIRKLVAEKIGYLDEKTIPSGAWPQIEKGINNSEWYKNNKDVYRYMERMAKKDSIGKTFSEAMEFATERIGGHVKLLNTGKLTYPGAYGDKSVLQFAMRNFDGNHRMGEGQNSSIRLFDKKTGDSIKWENLPVDKETGKKVIDANKYKFQFKNPETGKWGKEFWDKTTIRKHGSSFEPFKDVYRASNEWNEVMKRRVIDPLNVTGPKISMKKLLTRLSSKPLALGHEEALGGVRGNAFKNIKVMTQDMNLSLFNAYDKIQNKALRKEAIKYITGDLKGLEGKAYIDAFVENAEKRAGDILTGKIDKKTLYREFGEHAIGKAGSDILKWGPKKQTEALRIAGIDWTKPEGRLALKTLTTAQTLNKFLLSKGHKICRGQLVKAAGGGRIGFKGVCGAEFAKNFPEEFINRIGDYPGAAKAVNSANPGVMKKFLNAVAKDASSPFGWIGSDLIFATMYSGDAEARGKTPLEALDEGMLWFLPKEVIDAKKKALFGYEGTPSGAYKMEGHAGMYDKDQIADMSAYLDLEETDTKWQSNVEELAALNTKINTNSELFGQVTDQQIENSRNRLQSNIDEASDAGNKILSDIKTRNTGLRFEDGKPFKKEFSDEEFKNLYEQTGTNLWDVQKRYAMAEINRAKQGDLNLLYAKRKDPEAQLPFGMGEAGRWWTGLSKPTGVFDLYRASSPLKASERLPGGIKQGYQKILDLWNMGLVSQEEKEQYAKDMGREDLLRKEHEHPQYGPGLSMEQYKRVFPEYFDYASGGRAGYTNGGIMSLKKKKW